MDQHLRAAPLERNMPVLLALIGIWYNNFFRADSQAILPYDNRLDRFPAYLQQLQMESSGKGVRRDGAPVRSRTGSIIWGEPGSNAQHSFYQLLHQGTRFAPVDFILPVASSGGSQAQQDLAIANCLAQSEALMDGYLDTDSSHRVHPGNRPSNTILMKHLTPNTLGQLIALYEHKVFVEGVIWGVNSFDQYGVELGKRLAGDFLNILGGQPGSATSNESTNGLMAHVKNWRP
jgi:glucose-6-phosphate isomerase